MGKKIRIILSLVAFTLVGACVPLAFFDRGQRLVVIFILILAIPCISIYYLIANNENSQLSNARLCAHCGYDISESESRCPECGKVVPSGHITTGQIVEALQRIAPTTTESVNATNPSGTGTELGTRSNNSKGSEQF